MQTARPIRRALISVYDKTGLEGLAQGLHAAGVTLVSTGSTAGRIAQAGVPVTPVEELTGFPETLEGRVKTLHPRVHAGILADTRKPEHLEQIAELGIEAFDLVVVNLYPFTETVASGALFDDLRRADRHRRAVDGARVGEEPPERRSRHRPLRVLRGRRRGRGEGFSRTRRTQLAADAFAHTAAYDVAVASWMAGQVVEEEAGLPSFVGSAVHKTADLRYGENPHQRAAVYAVPGAGGAAGAVQLGGKEMSFNNYQDIDAAIRAAYDFTDPAVAIIKHANPCGLAVGDDIADAHRRAHATDPVSAYGGVIAANREVTLAMAESVKPIFTEVLAAPSFAADALELLRTKKNLRLLELGEHTEQRIETKQIGGGLLVQERDLLQADGDQPTGWTLAAGEAADEATMRDLVFAWRACRSVKSNAILLARDGAAVGVGMGQVNRVDSARLAVERAGEEHAGGLSLRVGCVLPVRGWTAGALRRRCEGDRPAGRIDPRRGGGGCGSGCRRHEMYFTGSRHFLH